MPIKKVFQACLMICAVLATTGCAAITQGTSQEITVITNPPGAACVFEREGRPIGTIVATPSTLLVKKTKHDIFIKCNKPGYQEAQYLNHSGTTAAIAANVAADLILTLGVASIIDSASGADNLYDGSVNISMVPVGPVVPVAAAATPPATETTVAAVTPAATSTTAPMPAARPAMKPIPNPKN